MSDAQAKVDVFVMGGGLAGLTAGLRVREHGRSVMVAEQGNAPDYPCNSRYSGGIFHVAYTDMKAPPDALARAIRTGSPSSREAQVNAIAGVAGRVIDWLQSHGTKFMRASALDWHRWTAAPPRLVRPGLASPGRGLDVLLRRLTEKLRESGGAFLLGHSVTGLTPNDGGYSVRLTRADGNETTVASRSVVIADGGFQSNLDMLKAHITPRPDLLLQRGAGTSRGDGLRLAAAVGARLTDLSRFYGHLLHRDALTNADLWPYPQIDTVAVGGIVVGPDGRRIADEGRGGVYLSNMVAALPDPTSAVAIFDQNIWDSNGRETLFPVNPHVENAGGAVTRADTLAALAQRIALPADALTQTVAEYNAAISAGAGARLSPPRSGIPRVIGHAPYLAIPLCVGITHTTGGILVDGAMRALDQSETAIPGLYAAGTATGGLDGGETAGYAGGLIKAAGMGLLAADDAAHHVSVVR